MQYHTIIIRKLILNIDCEDIFHHLDTNDSKLVSHYQRVVILQDLQRSFVLLYIGGKTIITDNVFREKTSGLINKWMHNNLKVYCTKYCQINHLRTRGLI